MGNSIDKVCTGLYVGGLMGATKKELLKENNITHVLTLLDNAQPHFPEDFTYKCITISDSPTCNLGQHFKECLEFIHQCRVQGGSCYVHCAAGISRSVTICTMYILTISVLTYDEAMAVMQYKRSPASPNFGFRMQLKKYVKTSLESERQRLKTEYPHHPLNDEMELEQIKAEAFEMFAKNGRPPVPSDDDVYVDMYTLDKSESDEN